MNDPPNTTAVAISSSLDPTEVARFSDWAAEWWDPKGKLAPLHRFNPTRLAFIRDWFSAHLPRLAGAVNALVVSPLVGRIVAAAGELAAAEFRNTFTR